MAKTTKNGYSNSVSDKVNNALYSLDQWKLEVCNDHTTSSYQDWKVKKEIFATTIPF